MHVFFLVKDRKYNKLRCWVENRLCIASSWRSCKISSGGQVKIRRSKVTEPTSLGNLIFYPIPMEYPHLRIKLQIRWITYAHDDTLLITVTTFKLSIKELLVSQVSISDKYNYFKVLWFVTLVLHFFFLILYLYYFLLNLVYILIIKGNDDNF